MAARKGATKLPRQYWTSGEGYQMFETGLENEEIVRRSGASLLAVRKARIRHKKRERIRPPIAASRIESGEVPLSPHAIRLLSVGAALIGPSNMDAVVLEAIERAIRSKVESAETERSQILERLHGLERENAALQARVDQGRLRVAGDARPD